MSEQEVPVSIAQLIIINFSLRKVSNQPKPRGVLLSMSGKRHFQGFECLHGRNNFWRILSTWRLKTTTADRALAELTTKFTNFWEWRVFEGHWDRKWGWALSNSSTFSSIQELGLSKLFPRWLPRFSTPEQKPNRLHVYEYLLAQFLKEGAHSWTTVSLLMIPFCIFPTWTGRTKKRKENLNKWRQSHGSQLTGSSQLFLFDRLGLL